MKKLIYLFGAMALMFGFTACGPDNNDEPGDGPINIVLDGFYIYGDAVGTQEFLAVNQMAAGSNEVEKAIRTGMYEKYIWLEANKDFSLVENMAGNKKYYSATLAEVNYGYDEADPNCKNFADNPNMKILAGQMIVGEEAAAMQVKESGMYHIVLDNNAMGDLEYPQIIIQRAKWGVRGGMNGWGFTEAEETVNADGSVTYTLTEQNLAKNGEYKWASCHGWKINLDVDGLVKAEVSLGLTEGKLHNAAQDNIKVEAAGLYTLTLTWKPASGGVADAFAYTQECTQESSMPETMNLIGVEFGNWDWNNCVEMIPVHSAPGKFWTVRYVADPANGFKFCALKEWNGDFTGLGNDTGYTVANGNCFVAEAGLYTMIVDLNAGAVTIAPAQICGLGDAFGGWDNTNAGQVAATVNADGTASITATAAGLLRSFAKIEGVDAWKSEFSVLDGTIVYRGNAGDFDATTAVEVTAGQTITYNFNAGTATIQ